MRAEPDSSTQTSAGFETTEDVGLAIVEVDKLGNTHNLQDVLCILSTRIRRPRSFMVVQCIQMRCWTLNFREESTISPVVWNDAVGERGRGRAVWPCGPSPTCWDGASDTRRARREGRNICVGRATAVCKEEKIEMVGEKRGSSW